MNNQQDHRWKYNNDKEQGIVQKKNKWTVNSKDQKETKNHTKNNKKTILNGIISIIRKKRITQQMINKQHNQKWKDHHNKKEIINH